MSKKTTQIGWIAGAGLGAAAAAALRRRWWGGPAGSAGGSPDRDRAATASGNRFLEHLAAAVQIPTVSHEDRSLDDPVPFQQFHDFLAEAYPLIHEHLERETVAGRSALYTWAGSDPEAPPLLLMAHIDVVPVEPGTEADWPEEPFSGAVSGGYLWGRGALDDKASLIGIFEAVESLLAGGFAPGPTVYLALGHDEEVGGVEGAASIAGLLAERSIRIGLVLDEGGAVVTGVLPGVDEPAAFVGIGEKGFVNLELAVEASGGHSSMPPPSTAVGRLAAAISAVERHPMPARLEKQRPLFDALAPMLPLAMGLALRNADRLRPLVDRRLSASPATNALIRTTAAVTMVEGGIKPNLLPQRASAVANVRIMPGDTIDGVLEHVRSVVGEGVSVRVIESGFVSDPPPIADPGSSGFGLVADTVQEVFSGMPVVPWIVTGATDSRHFVPVADTVLRFAPLTLNPDDLVRVHGTGERIRVADADIAVEFYSRLIRNTAG